MNTPQCDNIHIHQTIKLVVERSIKISSAYEMNSKVFDVPATQISKAEGLFQRGGRPNQEQLQMPSIPWSPGSPKPFQIANTAAGKPIFS